MKIKHAAVIVFFCILVLTVSFPLSAVQFRFKYAKGDSYRILSTVQENVFVNGTLDHYAQIVNRISVEVTDTAGTSGTHKAVFMTTENSTGNGNNQFSWGEEYTSVFSRNEFGHYTISDEYFMPVVRDVPVFPDKDMEIGNTWIAQGHEAHDMRRAFGLEKPYKVPFTATYTYSGTVKDGEKLLHVIDVRYNLYFDSPAKPSVRKANQQNDSAYQDYPVTTMGYSHQTIYWDNERGAISHYNEDFRIIVETAYGNTFEFAGKAQAEIQEATSHSSDRLDDVQKQIEELGIENAQVRVDEKGLTISLENIQFKADSAVLLESEKAKLLKIADVLKIFPDNDLLISGHTALAGNESARKELSERRAQAVADYLMQIGVRDSYHIFTQGMGGEYPVAPNTTEENKARNRRVEITVMDK